MPERADARGRVVHQNLDTAYVNLAALVRHLQQRDFGGRVHVELDEYDADIYLAARERPRVRERDHVTGRETSDEGALQRVLVRASEPGGLVSVFEGAGEAGVEGERASAAAQFAGRRGRDTRETAAREEIDRRNVLQLSGELISAVERAVEAAAREAVAAGGGEAARRPVAFAGLFRAARAEVAPDYPFLRSLGGCVEYAGGEARLARGADAAAFVEGVCEALRRVVERAAAEDGGARGVRREVARELAALQERRPQSLARFGFTAQLERIAGLRWT